MTAGVIFKFGQCVLDKTILEYRSDKEKEKRQEDLDKVKSACRKYEDQLKNYKQLLSSGFETKEKPTLNELKLWMSVRKKKEDGPMPTTKVKLLELKGKLENRAVLSLRDYLLDEGRDLTLIDLYFASLGNVAEV